MILIAKKKKKRGDPCEPWCPTWGKSSREKKKEKGGANRRGGKKRRRMPN